MKEKWIAHSTLVELWLGIPVWGLVFELLILIFLDRKGYYSLGLWLGLLGAGLVAVHMEHTISRALDAGEAGANKVMVAGYLVRYFTMAVLLAVLAVSGIGDPIAAFIGLFTLKLSAYLQPLTHRISVAVCGSAPFEREMISPEEQDRREEEYKAARKAASES
ncbi:MAG: hypothetical protein K6E50_03750 [Lachnospiraceae bacterium]|nr:hypothetical protein [Lachnospiraceae bacterium]